MKRTKIIISLAVTLLFSAANITHVNAMTTNDNEPEFAIKENYIIDNAGHKYSHFTNTSGESVSLEEALNILNGNINTQSVSLKHRSSRGPVPGIESVTVKSVVNKYVGGAKKITQDVEGPLAVAYTVSTTSSSSISGSFTATAKRLIFNTVEASVSVEITNTKTSTDEVSVSGTVDYGKKGSIYFKPYYLKASGTYTSDGGQTTQSFTSYYPLLTDTGFADGLFYLYQY